MLKSCDRSQGDGRRQAWAKEAVSAGAAYSVERAHDDLQCLRERLLIRNELNMMPFTLMKGHCS